MLTITNLALVLSQPNTLYISNKQLKISAGSSTAVTKSIARSSEKGELHWDDVLAFPSVSIINCEITTRHQFGYSSEELSTVIQGKINITSNFKEGESKLITTSVFNLQDQKVGYLKANVRLAEKTLASSQIVIRKEQKQIGLIPQNEDISKQSPKGRQNLLITSVIAHVNEVKGKTIYLKFKWSANQVISEKFSSKAGEIVYIGNYQIQSTQNTTDTQLIVELYDSTTSIIMANAVFFIDSLGKLVKKGFLRNNEGKQLGEMYIEGKVIEKIARTGTKSVLDMMNPLSPKESSQSSLAISMVNRKKSIINSNRQIRFTKEVRFFRNLQDKKSDYVSYLGGGSFDFRQPQSSKFYRGASIGRGSKFDFSSKGKNGPGVGEYFLPSIWDRY